MPIGKRVLYISLALLLLLVLGYFIFTGVNMGNVTISTPA